MLVLLALFGCGSSSVTLAGPEEALLGPKEVLDVGGAIASARSAVDSLKVERIDFTSLNGMKVRKACGVGLDGMLIGSELDEEACAETPEVFAKRLLPSRFLGDFGEAAGLDTSTFKELGIRSLHDSDGAAPDAILNLMALEKFAEGASERMVLGAQASAAGIRADLWDCAGTYARTRAAMHHELLEGVCEHEKRDVSDDEVVEVLEQMALRRKQAQDIETMMTRIEDPWTAAGTCSGITSKVATNVPASESVAAAGRAALVVPVIAGEVLTFKVSSMQGPVAIQLFNRGCTAMIEEREVPSYGWEAAPAGPNAAYERELRWRAPEAGQYVVVATVQPVSDVGMFGAPAAPPSAAPAAAAVQFDVSTDGGGGPSEEERADAKAYATWFDGTFPGVTPASVEADSQAALKAIGDQRKEIEMMVRAGREGKTCVASAVVTEDLLQIGAIDDGLKACEAQLKAAFEARVALSKGD